MLVVRRIFVCLHCGAAGGLPHLSLPSVFFPSSSSFASLFSIGETERERKNAEDNNLLVFVVQVFRRPFQRNPPPFHVSRVITGAPPF